MHWLSAYCMQAASQTLSPRYPGRRPPQGSTELTSGGERAPLAHLHKEGKRPRIAMVGGEDRGGECRAGRHLSWVELSTGGWRPPPPPTLRRGPELLEGTGWGGANVLSRAQGCLLSPSVPGSLSPLSQRAPHWHGPTFGSGMVGAKGSKPARWPAQPPGCWASRSLPPSSGPPGGGN